MEKITAQRTQLEVESNDLRTRGEDESSGDQVRTLSDFEMGFVGGGDDIPGWGGKP